MTLKARLMLVIGAMTIVLASLTTAAHAATLKLNEDFNGPLNKSVWTQLTPWGTHYTAGPDPELQWYNDANLSFVNGSARLMAEKRTANGYNYQSGILTTPKIYSYGYYEVRAKMPRMGKGVWPAIWLTADGPLEIDILEMPGYGTSSDNKDVYMTYHRSGSQITGSKFSSPVDLSQAYHTFAVDWQPTYIKWYIDGVERKSYSGSVPGDRQCIILNTAIGGPWPPDPDASTPWPQVFDIDYVRVWDVKPSISANVAPVAGSNAYTVTGGTTLSIAAPGVLGNDSDANGDPLTASVATQPAHGTLSMAANGSFTYRPAAGYTGADSFTYRASDGKAQSAAASVSLTVRDPGAPVAGTSLTIRTSAYGIAYPRPFVLSGVLAPGSAGDLVRVEVRKPGSLRWSYSSARVAFGSVAGGGTNWWYRYLPTMRGTYAFRASFAGDAGRATSVSPSVLVKVK